MKTPLLILLSLLPLGGFTQSVYPGQHAGKLRTATVIPLRAEAFDLQRIELLPSRLRDNRERDSAWIMSIPAGRLLHSFRTNAGVNAGREGGYMTVQKLGGWESLDCELRGHTTGHLLSACALMYAATGQEVFRAKADSLVNGLLEVQQALGSGYLSAFPEELINRNIAGKSVWAPWYTLHKILAGLLDQYLYADNAAALDAAQKMAGWAYEKLAPQSEATRRLMLRNEFGGMPEAWWNLYAATGSEQSRWLARYFYHHDVIDPLKARRQEFGTKHTNTFIPKVLAEAREYELTGNDSSRTATEFFWHEMVRHHTFAPGCSSDKEHFFDPNRVTNHITGYTGETCCTYNMLKLARHLFCWTADESIAGYYERALYNHILGQQDPATGMVCYFLPLAAGTHKVYSTPENSFWCCVGSGFENHAKYSEAIYYHRADTLYVNLLIPSQLAWSEKGITLTQQTRFPESEISKLTLAVEKPTRATLCLRYPTWSGRPEVTINGRRQAVRATPGGYISLQRTWRNNDRIEIRYPMSLRIEAVPGDPARGALFFGPVLLAGRLGTQGFEGLQPDSDPAKYNDYYTYDYRIPVETDASLSLNPAGIRRNGTTLSFTTPDGQELAPLYDIHRERYVVYWNLK